MKADHFAAVSLLICRLYVAEVNKQISLFSCEQIIALAVEKAAEIAYVLLICDKRRFPV